MANWLTDQVSAEIKPLRFVGADGAIRNVDLGDAPKAIEHKPIMAESAHTPTGINAEPEPSPPKYDFSNVIDQPFCDARIAQLHTEHDQRKLREQMPTRGKATDSTGDPMFMGGEWKRGSCDQPPPKKRKERIIG
jgi:hypothetical protein